MIIALFAIIAIIQVFVLVAQIRYHHAHNARLDDANERIRQLEMSLFGLPPDDDDDE